MNKVIIMGRLTKKPELAKTDSGTGYSNLTVAVKRAYDREKTDYIYCTAWRQTAETICKYFDKGDMIAICGNIQTGSYTDSGGKKNYTTNIMVDEFYFCGSKKAQSDSGSDFAYSYAPNADELPSDVK